LEGEIGMDDRNEQYLGVHWSEIYTECKECKGDGNDGHCKSCDGEGLVLDKDGKDYKYYKGGE